MSFLFTDDAEGADFGCFVVYGDVFWTAHAHWISFDHHKYCPALGIETICSWLRKFSRLQKDGLEMPFSLEFESAFLRFIETQRHAWRLDDRRVSARFSEARMRGRWREARCNTLD